MQEPKVPFSSSASLLLESEVSEAETIQQACTLCLHTSLPVWSSRTFWPLTLCHWSTAEFFLAVKVHIFIYILYFLHHKSELKVETLIRNHLCTFCVRSSTICRKFSEVSARPFLAGSSGEPQMIPLWSFWATRVGHWQVLGRRVLGSQCGWR